MPENLQTCEYFLIEYTPAVLRETRVPIGLFLFTDDGSLVRHGFAKDWRHVRCLDPDADLALLSALPSHFEGAAQMGALEHPRDSQAGPEQGPRKVAGFSSDTFYRQLLRMREEWSGGLQISSPRGVLTADPAEEFDRLFREHIEWRAVPRERQPVREESNPGSRRWIHARFSEALRHHALWEHLARDVAVEQFTAPGDGFRIDFAYRPNGVTNYVHALSLERDWNQSKLLSYTFWRIREKSEARMTAVVADTDSGSERIRSCRRILADADIALQPLSLIDPYLDAVSKELRLM